MRGSSAIALLALAASTPAFAEAHDESGEAPAQTAAEAEAERAYHNAQQAYLSGLMTSDGWEMAIPQMRVGETIELAAPSNLAYGPRGRGPIPGGATLVFKVELLGIEGR